MRIVYWYHISGSVEYFLWTSVPESHMNDTRRKRTKDRRWLSVSKSLRHSVSFRINWFSFPAIKEFLAMSYSALPSRVSEWTIFRDIIFWKIDQATDLCNNTGHWFAEHILSYPGRCVSILCNRQEEGREFWISRPFDREPHVDEQVVKCRVSRGLPLAVEHHKGIETLTV